ncbi:MAG: hypothetical protein ACRDJU_00810 [Actinomycetota bacterium]
MEQHTEEWPSVPCPECNAPAQVVGRDAAPYRIVDAVNSGGAVAVYEAVELLEILSLTCSAGHRVTGPAEAVLRELPVARRESVHKSPQ